MRRECNIRLARRGGFEVVLGNHVYNRRRALRTAATVAAVLDAGLPIAAVTTAPLAPLTALLDTHTENHVRDAARPGATTDRPPAVRSC